MAFGAMCSSSFSVLHMVAVYLAQRIDFAYPSAHAQHQGSH